MHLPSCSGLLDGARAPCSVVCPPGHNDFILPVPVGSAIRVPVALSPRVEVSGLLDISNGEGKVERYKGGRSHLNLAKLEPQTEDCVQEIASMH